MVMEAMVRLSVAAGIFFVMIFWEYLSPRRQQMTSRKQRWPINLGLAGSNILLMKVTVGGAAYFAAIDSMNQSWGIVNQLNITGWLSVVLSVLLLDLAIYCQHVISHKWKPLWRLHQVHHTDIEIDATTALRFHPLEIFVSMGYKVVCIYLIGADPLAVILFEIILNATATFNHSNINLPLKVDKILRWIIITPDVHRIHHSTVQTETDSNYGFSISLWDRLFKTYVAEPEKTQLTLDIGLPKTREQSELGFVKLLISPFVKK